MILNDVRQAMAALNPVKWLAPITRQGLSSGCQVAGAGSGRGPVLDKAALPEAVTGVDLDFARWPKPAAKKAGDEAAAAPEPEPAPTRKE
jgi:hypothetical protein